MRSWLPCALLFALSALFLAPALGGSGFWWTDETRHAMGGVFILDLLRDLPLDDPMGYALRYFAQYPALALNWYLPGFYFVEAGFFALFGVSETVAHWTVFAFVLLAAGLWFDWVRTGWNPLMAFMATALFIAVPEWNHWSRSVMLEAPAIALLVLVVWTFERYLDRPAWSRAIAAGLAIAAALAVKQTVALLLPALLAYGLISSRRAALWRVQAVPAYLIAALAIALVALHALKFGNLGLAATVGDSRVEVGQSAARLSLERWLTYPRALIEVWGWPLALLSLAGALLPARQGEGRLALIHAWLLCWYVVMTLVLGGAGNAPRYTLYALPALAVLAARPLFLLRGRRSHDGFLVLLVVMLAFQGWRTLTQPVPRIDGYREVAQAVDERRTGAPVLFAGKHDGSFIFHLRQLDHAREAVVLRADKVLVSLAVHKYFGMSSHVSGIDDIRALIRRYGIEYVVIERPDIVGVPEFEMLAELLAQADFERVAEFPVHAAGGAEAPERIVLHRYRDHVPAADAEIVIPLPHLGREIRFRRAGG